MAVGLVLAGCPEPTPTPDGTDTDSDSDGDTDVSTGLPAPTGDPATIELAGACPQESLYGSFKVGNYDGYAAVDGAVADGVVPITILEPMQTTGDCVLKRKNNPFCNPTCDPSETCDFDGQCVPYPTNKDVGQVTVAGLVVDVYMDPREPGMNYFDTSLSNPAFQPGDLIELVAAGGELPGFTLHGVGIEGLAVPEEPLVVNPGDPLVLDWTPLTEAGRGVVNLRLNIDQHGTTPVSVFCEFDDDGEGTVPAEAIDALTEFGVSGYPSAILTRQTVDSADVDEGCVEFHVLSIADAALEVAGYIPCSATDPCPGDLTCDLELGLCE